MTRIPITFWGCAIPLFCATLAAGTATGADDAKSPEQKAPPPKVQEQKPAEPKKEKDEKKEEKKEDKKDEKPSAPAPAPKSQDAKPSDTPTGSPDSKKEDTKAPPSPSSQKAQDKPTEAKPTVPPILAVKLALMADPRLFPYEINVEMSGEVVELSGKVGDDAEKAAATEIAKGLEGIKSVTNNIEVIKDLNRAMAKKRDDIITQYVKDRFGKSKTLEMTHFDVKSDDGIVSLSGKTKFFVIVLEAAEAARQVPGVKAVKTGGIRLEGAD